MKFFAKRKKDKFYKRFLASAELAKKRKHFVKAFEARDIVETPPADGNWMEYMRYIESEYKASGMEIIMATALEKNLPKNKVLALIELERKMFLEKESQNRLRFHIILTMVSVLIAFAALWRN